MFHRNVFFPYLTFYQHSTNISNIKTCLLNTLKQHIITVCTYFIILLTYKRNTISTSTSHTVCHKNVFFPYLIFYYPGQRTGDKFGFCQNQRIFCKPVFCGRCNVLFTFFEPDLFSAFFLLIFFNGSARVNKGVCFLPWDGLQ